LKPMKTPGCLRVIFQLPSCKGEVRHLSAWLAILLLLVAQLQAGNITGVVQTATGGAIAYGTFTFTLSQPAVLSGTATVVTSPANCYTDVGGNIVAVPDPLAQPVTSSGSGTLAGGTYYTKLAYWNASGVSNPSPENVAVLSGSGFALLVNAPVVQPSNASGYKVYIGTSSGTETLQGTVTGWTQFSQSTPLGAGSALPSSNTSVCALAFSDQLIPTGTAYAVGLTNKNGSTIAGFPQTWCTYGGAAGTINISNGAPTGNCGTNGVFYPTPLFAGAGPPPINNSLQSISGPISTSGLTDTLTAGSSFSSSINFATSSNYFFNIPGIALTSSPFWISDVANITDNKFHSAGIFSECEATLLADCLTTSANGNFNQGLFVSAYRADNFTPPLEGLTILTATTGAALGAGQERALETDLVCGSGITFNSAAQNGDLACTGMVSNDVGSTDDGIGIYVGTNASGRWKRSAYFGGWAAGAGLGVQIDKPTAAVADSLEFTTQASGDAINIIMDDGPLGNQKWAMNKNTTNDFVLNDLAGPVGRATFFHQVAGNASTELDGVGTGAIRLGFTAGTGGTLFGSGASSTVMTVDSTGQIIQAGVAFASLGTPAAGSQQYCTDCQVTTAASCATATPASCVCKNSGNGAFAKRMNYQGNGLNWYCQ
jgi:hypothetical protein